jgi:hypothetical protein
MWYSNDPRVRAIQVGRRSVVSKCKAVCNRAVDCDPLGLSGGGSDRQGSRAGRRKKHGNGCVQEPDLRLEEIQRSLLDERQ